MNDKRFDLADLTDGLSSLKTGGKSWGARCHAVKGVIIVGPSCSGKTTLLNAVRESPLCRAGKVSVPLRYITRPQRQNDTPQENAYISQKEFITMAKEARISFYWKKKMDPQREEMFGFAPPEPRALPVYSGNNGLLYNTASVFPSEILDELLFVGIFAPDEIRSDRLARRSPDLTRDKPQEVQYRLMDSSEAMIPQVHLVINNYGPYAKHSGRDIIELLRRLWDLL